MGAVQDQRDSDLALRAMIEVIVKRIVDDPAAVRVDETATDDVVTYQIQVAAADAGRVIGRQGKVIRALRVLVRSVAAQGGRRVDVELARE